MTLLPLYLLACTGNEPGSGSFTLPEATPWTVDLEGVRVDGATEIRRGVVHGLYGWRLTSGSDLDKDGVVEWAVADPRLPDFGNSYAAVEVFEGEELLTERHPPERTSIDDYGRALATGDVDGDGFRDLIYSATNIGDFFLHVATSTKKRDDATIELDVSNDERENTVYPMTPWSAQVEERTDGTPGRVLLNWANAGTSAVTWSTLPTDPSTFDNPLPLELGPVELTLVGTNRGPYQDLIAYMGKAVLLEDTAGEPEWLGGRGTLSLDDGTKLGRSFVCPTTYGLRLDEDCTWLGEEESDLYQEYQTAFDFDGDGSLELVTSVSHPAPHDGEVTIFERDGTWRASLRGTLAAQFGFDHHAVVDDHGDAWLLTAQTNLAGEQPGTVYAFRGDNLYGELTDQDADRLYVHPASDHLGYEIETYRPTPDSELMLLLSDPFNGDGVVFMLPFDPA